MIRESLPIIRHCGVLTAIVLLNAAPATAAFQALDNINVTGSGLVPTESDYVPNVVKCENGLASFEALKAQAVAARTFAYYKMNLQGFINDGTSDQVYTCSGSAGPLHHAAAQATEGEILTIEDFSNNDILIASFYVAGAFPSDPSGRAQPGDPDPTNTEQWVTYPFLDGVIGGDNIGSPLGFQGTPQNPNWPNRGAKSQNGADFLSDDSTYYADILKFYYGSDIQLETVIPAGGSPRFGEKVINDFDDYSGLTDGTISGNEGYFGWAPTTSGSNINITGATTADRSSDNPFSGGHAQRLDIDYDEAGDVSGDGFLFRHLAGAQNAANSLGLNVASGIANLRLEATGSVGFHLRTDTPGLEVSIAVDDPTTGDRGVLRPVIADGQWHRYEWFLDVDAQWEAWIAAGDGVIGGQQFTLDSIQLFGGSDAVVYLDDVFHDASAVLPVLLGDANKDGQVTGADLISVQQNFGNVGPTPLQGDADNNGQVTGTDLIIVQQNFGNVAAPASATIPEPGTLGVLALSLFGLVKRTRAPRIR